MNSFIVMASSNEYSRKILNSPTYAEPALVHSGKLIMGADNWWVNQSSSASAWELNCDF